MIKLFLYKIYSKKRESRERDVMEKQWTEMEMESKTIDVENNKKNGEDKSLSTTTTSSVDESIPKVNPVKWTVCIELVFLLIVREFVVVFRKFFLFSQIFLNG